MTSPTYKAYVKGKLISDLTQSEDINLIFELNANSNIPNLQDIQEYGILYSYKDNESPKSNSSITIKDNGTYNYSAYIMFDEISSSVSTVSITRRNLTGITIAVIIIIFIIIVVGAGYYIVKWFRQGAVVEPLSEKEIYNMRKREKRFDDFKLNDEDYISGLDKPRHNDRVSDRGYSEDNFKENIDDIRVRDYKTEIDNYNNDSNSDGAFSNDDEEI